MSLCANTLPTHSVACCNYKVLRVLSALSNIQGLNYNVQYTGSKNKFDL